MSEATTLQRWGGRIGKMFATGYDAVRSSTKRKAASPILKSEDEELKNRDRHSMIGATRDLARNFAGRILDHLGLEHDLTRRWGE